MLTTIVKYAIVNNLQSGKHIAIVRLTLEKNMACIS